MKQIRIITALIIISFLSGCAALGFDSAVYGCWCGKGEPPEGENPYPIDIWDAACMRHDICYRNRGINNPQCDMDFINELRSIHARNPYLQVPAQMQVAHDFFYSRLAGRGYYINMGLNPNDIGSYIRAGRGCTDRDSS